MNKLKTLVVDVINFSEEVVKDLEDGKISLTEGIGLGYELLSGFLGNYKNGAEIVAELKALTPENREELKKLVASELDVPNDYVEQKVEALFNLLVDIEAFFAIKKPAV